MLNAIIALGIIFMIFIIYTNVVGDRINKEMRKTLNSDMNLHMDLK